MKKVYSNAKACMFMTIFIVFTSELTIAASTTKEYQELPPPTTPMSIQAEIEKWKSLKLYPDNSVFSKATPKPESDSWDLPNWSAETMPPWLDTDVIFGGDYEPYNPNPNMDMDGLDIDVGVATPQPPIHNDFDDANLHNLWDDDDNKMGSYTWITMAIVLVVFFKMAVIAIMIARRVRHRQHQFIIRSSNSSSVNIPSEFTSDQAHLVTPASIVYVDPNNDRHTPIPQLFTPPPYSESLLPNSGPPPATPGEDPPPYSG